MQSRTFPMGPLETNCYLVFSEKEKEAIVIDPGGPSDEVLDFLTQESLTLTHILLTHLHFDHTYGVQALTKATDARAFASEKDRFMLSDEMGNGGLWGMPPVPQYDYTGIKAGKLALAGGVCTVLETPGHSPGGLSFYFEGMRTVFAGDSLFYRSIGRTDLAGGKHDLLLRSIREQLFTLPEETTVFPGHGPSSSIGDEIRHNPYSSAFIMI